MLKGRIVHVDRPHEHAKVTTEEVRYLKYLLERGYTPYRIHREIRPGVTRDNIQKIRDGKSWKTIELTDHDRRRFAGWNPFLGY